MMGGLDGIPEPMLRLFRCIGIDLGDARRAGLGPQVAAMAEACRGCAEAQRCRATLGAPGTAAVPDRCPNAGRFALADGYLRRWRIAE
ncbi:DUF6455 family protein [Azospirillum sp. ST 5-10]|uniref:DUF6455 family protein n=1 Tax=unclassified Azospirillum TaxID=2630922 RepID=UPI003F49CC3D